MGGISIYRGVLAGGSKIVLSIFLQKDIPVYNNGIPCPRFSVIESEMYEY